MNWFEYFLYGIVSGLSELLPISSYAHQTVFKELCGIAGKNSLHDLFVHIAVLVSIVFIYRTSTSRSHRRNSRADLRHLKTAMIPVFVGAVLYPITSSWNSNYLLLAFFLLINGVLLYVPSRMLSGNKSAMSMSRVDSLLVGAGAAFGAFPGISRMAGALSVASMRGADSENAFRWAIYLSIPAMCMLIISDILSLGVAAAYSINFFGVILSMIGTFAGAGIGYSIMHFLAAKTGFTWFSYYSWGAALFSFVLYLMV